MQRYLHNVTIGLHGSQPEDIYNEIIQIVTSNSTIIEDFLRTKGYIKFTDIPTHQYILTDEGEEAQRQGGHQKYLDWVEKEKDKSKKGELPKRNTIIYDGIKIAIPLIAGIFIGKYACNQPTKGESDQSKKQFQEKIMPQDTSRQSPKTLNRLTDVHVLDSTHYQDTQVTTKTETTCEAQSDH